MVFNSHVSVFFFLVLCCELEWKTERSFLICYCHLDEKAGQTLYELSEKRNHVVYWVGWGFIILDCWCFYSHWSVSVEWGYFALYIMHSGFRIEWKYISWFPNKLIAIFDSCSVMNFYYFVTWQSTISVLNFFHFLPSISSVI